MIPLTLTYRVSDSKFWPEKLECILRQLAFNGMLGKFPIGPEDKRMDILMRRKLKEVWEQTLEIASELHEPALALANQLVETPTLTWPEVAEILAPFDIVREE